MATDHPHVICVDLDGTLLATDTLVEGILRMVHAQPWMVLLLPLWLARGRAFFKAQVAANAPLDFSVMPTRASLLDWLKQKRDSGAKLWLCTGTAAPWAHGAAQHFGIFDGVICSDGSTNLTGARKADALVERFGDKGFTYCGDEFQDLQVWKQAAAGVVVGSPALAERARAECEVMLHVEVQKPSLYTWARALRLHQWAKNLLVLVPLLAAHRAADGPAWEHALLAFVAFCLTASAAYLINDLLDLPADRAHPRKRDRPLASGALSLPLAASFVPLLLLMTVLVCLALPGRFALVLTAYVVLTLAYTWFLKRFAMVDTLTLAALYTARLLAGAGAVQVPLSFWLLAFSGFLFFSLALVKRSAELRLLEKSGTRSASGRGYETGDIPLVDNLGIASGLLATLVLALYLNSPDVRVLYAHPTLLWGLCPLLVWWICRVWLLVHRGRMHDDPVVFALRDRASLVGGVLGAVLVWLAT